MKTSETAFDPYGVRLNGIGSVNSFQNRYEMQGHEKEATFGLNRVNFGARTLNPTTGVWDRIDPLAELDFNLGAYTYVGNNPINAVDLWGMKRVPIDGTRNYYDDETGELTVVGDRNNVNAAFGFDLMYQAHARNKREFGEASPFRQNFQQGGAIAAGVAAAPLAIIAAAEVGAAYWLGLSRIQQLRAMAMGRKFLRENIFRTFAFVKL